MTQTAIIREKIPIRVLLIDDQKLVAEKIRLILEETSGIELHFCEDSRNAIECVERIKPNVILLDLVMPHVDGMSLVRFLRGNAEHKDIPIVMLSLKDDPRVKSMAFNAGASDYLVKLPNSLELVARIRMHAKNYQTQKERDEALQKTIALQSMLEQSNSKLQRISQQDALTGVANRRRFDDFSQSEWQRCARRRGYYSIILLDIDYFKAYNDNYGHRAGDECLRAVADALREEFYRAGDLLARYGGEEFVYVLPDTELHGAVNVAERVREAVESLLIPHEYSDVCGHVTISCGVACCQPSSSGITLARLIEGADQALYQAKDDGRNRVRAHEFI